MLKLLPCEHTVFRLLNNEVLALLGHDCRQSLDADKLYVSVLDQEGPDQVRQSFFVFRVRQLYDDVVPHVQLLLKRETPGRVLEVRHESPTVGKVSVVDDDGVKGQDQLDYHIEQGFHLGEPTLVLYGSELDLLEAEIDHLLKLAILGKVWDHISHFKLRWVHH